MGFGYHAHQQPLGVRVPRPPPEWPRRKSRPLRRPPSDLSVCAHVRKSARASSAHGGPDGPEMGTLPTDFPTQAPDRSHRHSHRNDGGRADRRMSHRASRSALTCASPHARSTQHARTRGGRGGTGGPPASFPLRILARCACVVGLSEGRARAASGGGVVATATSRARTSARKCGRPCCCCGCGFLRSDLRSPDAGATREVRAAPAMHARRCLGTEARPRGHPPATQQPQGGLGPKSSQYRPICTRSLPRHPRAPPARAAHPRRPLAPPVRAARSRSPLAPSARAATSPHRHRARHRTLMVSLDFPIPSHLHTPLFMPPACAAARSARPREASEHERGAGHRASRGDFAQALRSAHTAPFR